MGSRLQLKFGLVAEQDRLSTSADTLLVNEPQTGSKTRTKGNLYLIVTSASVGGRARDATALVAESIRREYYYDESAGIPACLEKCFRSINRKLRGREGGGLAPGSVGIALAVVRSNELYVASVGDVDAYLVRAARLLMPDRSSGPGVPAEDPLRVDVWRGELSVGDSLLLVSRNLTEVVGTEELKNAVVTLHPQSAVEHLHHLFVAAGGEGSDALLAIEATELTSGRQEARLVPVAGMAEAYGELPQGSPIPLADTAVGAAGATVAGARGAVHAVTGAVGGVVDRVLDLMPRRRTSTRRITPQVSRRESQRRAAIALLAFLGVILVLGVAVWVFPRGKEDPVQQVSEGEAAYQSALSKADRVLGAGGLVTADPTQALSLLREAYHDIERAAATGVPATKVDPLRERIATGLDGLPQYSTHHLAPKTIAELPGGTDPIALARGPDKALYFIDQAAGTVSRVDPKTGNVVKVVTKGDGAGEGIGTPRILGEGGNDLLIADIRGNLWRWRSSDDKGDGTLGQIFVDGDSWGDDVTDIGTFSIGGDLYNLYVIDPSSNQILRYQPTADGRKFTVPTPYLVTDSEKVADYRRLAIDGDIYTLTSDDVIQHQSGKVTSGYKLATPPDDGDLRPGHDYTLIGMTGDKGAGRFYIWDKKWARVLVFEKSDGSYVEQWLSSSVAHPLGDLRGMVLIEPPGNDTTTPLTIDWVDPNGVFSGALVDVPVTVPSSPSPPASTAPKPTRSPRPTRQP